MDNVNKIISFVLGLIVVVVFIAIITGKFNVGKNIKTLTSARITPTVTPTPTVRPEPVTNMYLNPTTTVLKPVVKATPTGVKSYVANNKYAPTGSTTKVNSSNLSTIPSTGAPTFLLPLAFSMLAGGTFLRKSKSARK